MVQQGSVREDPHPEEGGVTITLFTSEDGTYTVRVASQRVRGESHSPAGSGECWILVDRKSNMGLGPRGKLGNPYEIGPDGNRDQVCDKYAAWLREEYVDNSRRKEAVDMLVRLLRHHGMITLVCWCSPERCHADFLAHAILTLIQKD